MASERSSLNDLGLGSDKLQDANFDDIPESLGQEFKDPPQPGKYRFMLPKDMSAIWAKVDSTEHGERINALFEDDAELAIAQVPEGSATTVGETFRTRISNIPRARTKEKILVSDMALLLRALGETATPKTNKAFAQALMKYAGKTFGATIEYSYHCNPKKDVYMADEAGGQQKVEGKLGCNARYYQKDVAKVGGLQPMKVTCGNPECGASIRGFANLTGFTK